MKNYKHILLLFLLPYSLIAQDSTKDPLQKYWKLRVNLSTYVAQKEGIDIDPKYIYYDFMNLPIGIPFNYLEYIRLDKYQYVDVDNDKLILPAYQAYIDMKKAGSIHNAIINIKSSYRNKSTQVYMMNKYGDQHAEKPGYSEHHLLTTIDIRYCGENTKLFLWLLTHAHEYGWIPSYYFRKDSQIRKEAWHWRFVGKDAAQWYRSTWENEYKAEIIRLEHI
ncbi:M15 family metallopeptidase [Flammeovirga pacifica]|uniref:D-alanyl-D-alanine carboxypeptidase-like core domain-containing protein n=1 Tax=Flammeovirga pacifica TaxID=915059 RepID=A0A1S1YW07_FLAPC|nr:D-alanyl-D-alanine carboxypeptidase family protein [Flammeovirga pacifica]OHX65190.1 hypothetical protein NH26_01895 [Flammeovirga pacifica]